VSELRIDPERFIVELRNADGKIIGADRLSAGERQLLAVSLLWGLARVSGRPVPVVTDTPLGRLDASHRTHLVERYFPQASHQMLLLSTDKEIDREYYDRLKPWIGHSYRLEFNEKSGSTQIQPGYFW
jgi:DNA sulfur modification protein DndD